MLSHKDPGKTKSSLWYFGFRIFYAHIIVIVLLVVLSLLLSMLQGAVSFSDSFMTIIVNIVCLAAYGYIVYTESWKIGVHDYNQVVFEKASKDQLKPLKAALGSQVIGIVIAVWIQFSPFSTNAIKYANFFYANFVFPIGFFRERGMNGVYLVPWIFAVVFAYWGYIYGFRQKHLADSLVYKRG